MLSLLCPDYFYLSFLGHILFIAPFSPFLASTSLPYLVSSSSVSFNNHDIIPSSNYSCC